MTPRTIVLAAAALLASCGPIVQIGGNDAAPDALLTLRAEAANAPARPVDASRTLAIVQPTVPGAIQTLRLPVTISDTQVQYLKAANWIEQPARLFQRLLADVVGARAGVTLLDPRQADVAPARRLTGELREFGLDVRGTPQVRVRYDALLTGADGRPVAARGFEATRPVATQAPADVGAALNDAANAVAGEVAAWIAAA